MIGTLRPVLPVLFFLICAAAFGQPFPIFNGQVNTCVGAFLDSGGQGGVGYGNNEDYTYTICPDNPGDAISVDFITANFAAGGAAPVDNMSIYDGDNSGAPLIGNWTGSALQGQVISASTGNITGCLTFVWHSNNTGLGIFAGSISCTTPCARPTALATISGGAPAMVCIGEAVTFNGTGSFAAPGFSLAQYTWDFDDGSTSNAWPVTSHSFANPGEYIVQLYLQDNNGCASTNRVDLQVLVGTEPTFTGTGGDQTGCLGETLCLDGMVNPATWSALPDANYGNGVLLPDNVGSCFTSELTYTQFPPGSTLNNIADLNAICFDIEHSFLGDLVISIISPSGETVILHQQGGAGTYLGIPDDTDDANPNPGTCWTYCIDASATNGTMAANAGTTLPAGTYESVQPLSGLLGSALNGTWTLEICDLWGLDNGFLCGFTLDFDPSLYNSLTVFTPVYGNACDSTWWTGPNITSSSGNCDQICVTPAAVGTFNYVYHAVDNFGCTYDTTISVTIVPGPQVDAGVDVVICSPGPVQLNALASGLIPPEPCVYTLDLFDTFGDGWDGATVTVTVNGVPTVYGMGGGTDISYNIPVVDGQSIQISYQPSLLFNNEHSYVLLDANGIAVFTDNPPFPNGVTFNGVADCVPGTGAVIYSWAPAAGLSDPNIANPVASVGATTTYTVTIYQDGYASCPSTSDITITVGAPVDAGTNGNITLCSSSAPVGLFASLGGTPDAGGTWTGPGGAFNGTLDPSSDPAGVYTYTVLGVAPCPNASATVTVTINTPPDPGTDGSITLCTSSAALALFAQLGGTPDAAGVWSGPSPVVGGMMDPANMSAGVYTYTVAGAAPCASEDATVTVATNTPPDPGTDGAVTLCTSSAAVPLFAQLGGTPDAGGVWSGPSPVVGGMIDPANMNAGAYTYTVVGVAPCPSEDATVTVTINTPPDPGTDGSIALCTSSAPASLFAQLGGIPDAGGVWSGPSPVVGGMMDPANMSAGAYTYTVAGTAPCPSEDATVTVTINTPPDPGTDGAVTLCTSSGAVPLFAQLGGTPDAGGVWSGPSPVVGGMLDPANMSAGMYTYTVAGAAPCPSEDATVTVTINTPPDPGTDGAVTLCTSSAPVALFAQLGGTPDPSGVWTGPSPVVGGMLDPANMSAGMYTYTVAGAAPCPSEDAIVTVTINTPPDPGVDGAVTLCTSSAPLALFTQLGGTPDAGGVWSGPSPVVGGMMDPANMSAGVYTYTVAGAAPCASEDATVTVTINTPPDPGTDGAVTLCTSNAPVSLFAQLGGTPDAAGVWSGPSPVVGGMMDPANMSAGVYTYTVAGVAPCPSEDAIVTVVINPLPNAGSDGAAVLCATSPPTDLLSQLGGTPDIGGTWSGPSAVVGGMFNAGNMIPGTYIYILTGVAPCPNVSSTVNVSVVLNPAAGLPGAITMCANAPPIALFSQLGGTPDAGGTWTGPSPVVGGLFDPANMIAGVYTYTINVPPPCVDASSTVTINVVQPPDAGSDGALTLCISSPSASLFAALGGSPDAGGSWSGPSPVVGGLFNPANMTAGVYTYTASGTAPCPSDAATVTVTVVAAPDAGTPGSATLCATDAPIDLYVELGGTPDAGGAWSGPSPVVGGLFDPTNMVAGVYTYTISVPPPCVDASSTVTINVVQPPDAGSDGALTLCISSPSASLFAALGGNPDVGGSWSGPSPAVGGLFNPANMTAGVYTYTANGTAPCPSDDATVTVTVVAAPDAGTPGSATLCATDAPIDLYLQLGGTPDPGGAWSGPSPVVGGLFDPANMIAGVYTYTISVPPPCVNVSSTVTVAVVQPPNAGTNGTMLLCISSPVTDLFAILGGTPDVGGSWTGPNGLSYSGLFDPASDAPGVYTYTVAGTLPCPNTSASATVSVATLPDPGLPSAITLCASDAAVTLFAQLDGTPDAGGAWTDPNGLVFTGIFDPALHQPGAYTYTIAVPPPCASVSASVDVSVVQPPDPGNDGTLVACITGAPVDLFALLGGSPDPGGTWLDPNGLAHSGIFNPGGDVAGDYTYTAGATAPCPDLSSTVNVSITQAPDAGLDGILNLCLTGSGSPLFGSIGGMPNAGGTWVDPNGVAFGGYFTPGLDTPGSYTYTVVGTAPCPSDEAQVLVNVLTDADAGSDGNVVVCGNAAPMDLFGALLDTPDAGGIWLDPYNQSCTGALDPAVDPQGIYTYVLAVPLPCINDTALVSVGIVQPPDAGNAGALTLCSNDAPVPLFGLLGGDPDTTGFWTDPNGLAFAGTFDPVSDPQGAYVYTVQATAPCTDDTTTVMMSVEPLPDAGSDGSTVVCPEAAPVNLFALLGGTPGTGGSWTDPNGNTSNGVFDPALDPQGAYTYTVYGLTACPNATASATVTIYTVVAPDAGPDAFTCDLEYTLSATGNWGTGSWSGPAGVAIADPTSGTTGVSSTTGGSALFVFTIVSPDGCAAADSVIITFTGAIVPLVWTTDAICNNACDGTAVIGATGGNVGSSGYSYQWSSGIAGLTDTVATGLCAGSYTAIVLDTNSCSTVASFIINEPPPLVIDTVFAMDETCPGSCDGALTISDPQGAQYSFDSGVTFGSSPVASGLCAGTFSIIMQDANGCVASTSGDVLSPPPVIADFYAAPDSVLVSGPTIEFVNTSSNATSYVWDIAGLGTSTAIDPSFTFPDVLGDVYTVCLTASDANGCADTMCAPVVVLDLLIVHVPNTFTPNGDGTNDTFMPIFNDATLVQEYEFLIFDRWGERIWESNRVHESWNGGYQGRAVESEVYVWKLKYKDARSHETGSTIGHVTLLR